MTFDDWNNIVTSNAYWINLVLVMIILVVFYRQYREIHIRKECELLARMEIEKIKKELVKEIKAKNDLEMDVKRFRLIFKGLPLVVNNVITESDIEAFHFYILLKKNTSTIILNCSVEEWKKLFYFSDMISDRFYSRLLYAYPQLGQRELCLCCLIRLRFSNREIATLLGIKEESVLRSRNRLKKLLNVNRYQTLSNFDEYIIKY
ncbi:hypothetical protein NXX54_15805 [Bacteroides sp. BFG-638]|jgi:DNA-binding CsgD family transcriptional regulator|uniref:hypothetical protein n=1 Tax=Bacteroides TaxID=816 RepID=UPI002166BD40|nr:MULTISPECIES: hypothetical protein [unclassified Bacteroides]MCS2949747.1 hypothetical protein [Bacteroides sp. BFG-638]MCS3313325.1 hypothetical protein [Bacteroides sp. BFG-637]